MTTPPPLFVPPTLCTGGGLQGLLRKALAVFVVFGV